MGRIFTPLNNQLVLLFTAVSAILLSSCGGGGSSNTSSEAPSSQFSQLSQAIEITGAGIKGPLAHADVNLHELNDDFSLLFDPRNPVASGTTDANSSIQNLSIPAGTTLPLVLEVDGTNSIDLTTGKAPVIKKLLTVITREQVESGMPVYATPLSTLAYLTARNLAGTNTNQNNSLSVFLDTLAEANDIVLSLFNFDSADSINVFRTPPIIDSQTQSVVNQRIVAEYRAANEGFASTVFRTTMDLINNGIQISEDQLLSQLALDLHNDLRINNQSDSGTVENPINLDILATNILNLSIPNSDSKVQDISTILRNELQLGNSTATFLIQGYVPSVSEFILNADTVRNDTERSRISDNTIGEYLHTPLIVSDFANIANIPMSQDALEDAFGSTVRGTRDDGLARIRVVNRNGRHWLQQTFDHHTDGTRNWGLAQTGTQFRVDLPSGDFDDIYYAYDIDIPPDIVMTRHAKFGPSLRGGPEITTGGNTADGYNGFSARAAFDSRTNVAADDPRFYPQGTGAMYLYHADQPNISGQIQIAESNDEPRTWPLGQTTRVQVRVKMNTPETSQGRGNSRNDGLLQVWYDGELVIDERDMRWRHDDDIHIEDFFYSASYGGSDDTFATVKREMVWFSDMVISDRPIYYNPPR